MTAAHVDVHALAHALAGLSAARDAYTALTRHSERIAFRRALQQLYVDTEAHMRLIRRCPQLMLFPHTHTHTHTTTVTHTTAHTHAAAVSATTADAIATGKAESATASGADVKGDGDVKADAVHDPETHIDADEVRALNGAVRVVVDGARAHYADFEHCDEHVTLAPVSDDAKAAAAVHAQSDGLVVTSPAQLLHVSPSGVGDAVLLLHRDPRVPSGVAVVSQWPGPGTRGPCAVKALALPPTVPVVPPHPPGPAAPASAAARAVEIGISSAWLVRLLPSEAMAHAVAALNQHTAAVGCVVS